jgi:hypothetical protein
MKTKTKNNKFLNWFKPRNWGWIKVYRDFENFADWRKTIKREESDLKSKYNLWKLERTRLYDIYTIISLEDADANLTEAVKRTKVIETLNPLHRYLDDDLGFAECLNVEFNQFEDDEGKPTLSYLIVYRFNFKKFSLKWIAKFIIINAALIFVILHFNFIPLLIAWVSSLI